MNSPRSDQSQDSTSPQFKDTIISYIIYGIAFSGIILVPWLLVEKIEQQFPWFDHLAKKLEDYNFPSFVVYLIVLFVVILVLIGIGYLARKFLWKMLSHMPIVSLITSGVDHINERLLSTNMKEIGRVVWVPWPSDNVQTLGIIMETDFDRRSPPEHITVLLIMNAGSYKGTIIRRARTQSVYFTEYTVQEAMALITSFGMSQSAIDDKVYVEDT